jgi:hypothetical protein
MTALSAGKKQPIPGRVGSPAVDRLYAPRDKTEGSQDAAVRDDGADDGVT